jgi:hypothetical protein
MTKKEATEQQRRRDVLTDHIVCCLPDCETPLIALSKLRMHSVRFQH